MYASRYQEASTRASIAHISRTDDATNRTDGTSYGYAVKRGKVKDKRLNYSELKFSDTFFQHNLFIAKERTLQTL